MSRFAIQAHYQSHGTFYKRHRDALPCDTSEDDQRRVRPAEPCNVFSATSLLFARCEEALTFACFVPGIATGDSHPIHQLTLG